MRIVQGGRWLRHEYRISSVLRCLPDPAHPSKPYNLYQDHYKGILPGLATLQGLFRYPQQPLSSSLSPVLGSMLLAVASIFLGVLTRPLS